MRSLQDLAEKVVRDNQAERDYWDQCAYQLIDAIRRTSADDINEILDAHVPGGSPEDRAEARPDGDAHLAAGLPDAEKT